MPKTHRRDTTLGLLVTIVVTVLAVLANSPAAVADPDDEGGSKEMREELDDAIGNYNDARDALKTSKDRQKKLEKEITEGETEVEALSAQVAEIAGAMYENGGMSSAKAFLASENPDDTLSGMVLVSYLGEESAKKISELKGARSDLEAKVELLDDEIDDQKEYVEKMEKERSKAAQAIAAFGGDATNGPTTSDAPAPTPVPRNPDGSLPSEGCSKEDPTPSGNGGCLTPRTLHDLEQTEIAGWNRYVGCFRGGSFGEHPQGRACDFSVTPGGFGGEAYGEAKAYGDNLAGWYVEHADELGVLYVIWYRKIWMPGQGWTTYDGAGGEPNSDHTNHVHLSVR
ncbi:coiled-coil domain-containing protein [Phytomonospora endophytica]|uniref:Septal ring factor EnvC (AmiA/AmiB activator) n=1 Tax=Phytomonospora endophytica TaxID=714109 RepID=A0A841FGL2_9ACTN|nr:hypothetical protein [Phytomonospora endophytica]MBB6035004.1 septal ring factor EnvC (AmiA/AmiB activator) [Phytomonospora endophytica]GIG71445.1 hypothetical protein Pen01_77400 [Phytomonospora endophytica]